MINKVRIKDLIKDKAKLAKVIKLWEFDKRAYSKTAMIGQAVRLLERYKTKDLNALSLEQRLDLNLKAIEVQALVIKLKKGY